MYDPFLSTAMIALSLFGTFLASQKKQWTSQATNFSNLCALMYLGMSSPHVCPYWTSARCKPILQVLKEQQTNFSCVQISFSQILSSEFFQHIAPVRSTSQNLVSHPLPFL